MDDIKDLLPPCPGPSQGFGRNISLPLGFLTDFLSNDTRAENRSCWTFDASPYSFGFKKVMDDLNIYITPFIIFIGITGNFLSFLVFTLTHLRRQSSSVYLASLAIVDIVFLLSLCIVWLSWIKIPLFHKQGWCQLVVYMTYVCTFLSVWLVTSFTIDRFIFCYYPLRKERFCTTKRARVVVVLLVLAGLVTYSFATWTSGVNYLNSVSLCMPFPQYYNVLTTITAVDSAVTLIIPCSCVIILNIRIVLRIMSVEKQRQPFQRTGVTGLPRQAPSRSGGPAVSICHESLTSNCPVHVRFQPPSSVVEKRTSGAAGHHGVSGMELSTSKQATRSRRRRSHQYRTARMLIIVSSVFVLLNLPGHIFRVHAFIQSSIHDEFSAYRKDLTWHEIFNLVYHLNFSINFFIYSACGRQFRTGLRILYTRFQHKAEMFRMWRDKRKLPSHL